MINSSEVMQETGPETIQRVLASYALGQKIRQLRMKKKIGLVDLGKHTGLSASMLSQLENGKIIPTLPTLARIAMVFDVGMDHFFSDRRKRGKFAVIREAERMRFPERSDAPKPGYHFECLAFSSQEKGMQAYMAFFEPREPAEVAEHVHDGAELIHVLEGELGLRYMDEEEVLNCGDSVYFDGSQPHGYRAVTKSGAKAIVITTLPRP
jgi:transcriptional regulator with XRE-family HTH domain